MAVVVLALLTPVLGWIGVAAIAVIVWFSAASFLTFHWMFDRSVLLSGTWLRSEVLTPRRWVQVSTALDETTLPLDQIFPGTAGRMIDVYDPETMTEPALKRAREATASGATIAAVEDRWADVVVVMLAAHEIRDRSAREHFFAELARIVSADGKVVLVEHLRDFAAAAAFGPGVFHFFPRSEWLRLSKLVGLEIIRERPITPFVRVFVLERPGF